MTDVLIQLVPVLSELVPHYEPKKLSRLIADLIEATYAVELAFDKQEGAIAALIQEGCQTIEVAA
jgi:hypothetical protein